MRTTTRIAWYSSDPISPPYGAMALVLAGGKGTRLRAADDAELRRTPKVLVPIERADGAIAMLGHVLAALDRCGFPRIAVLTGADPEAGSLQVETYALSRQHPDRPLYIYREPYPLGTAGAVYAALTQLTATFGVIVPADTLFPHLLLPSAINAHRAAGNDLTWTVTTRPGTEAQNPGRLLLESGASRIAQALEGVAVEHPHLESSGLRPATSAGVVIVTRARYVELFESYVRWLDAARPTDLYKEFIPWLLSRGMKIGAFDIAQEAPDLGTPDRLARFGRPSHRAEPCG